MDKSFDVVIFRENTKFSDIKCDLNVDEIRIVKSSIGQTEDEKIKHNFLAVGRANREAKKLIAHLANNSYFLTSHKLGVSCFTKYRTDRQFINNFDKPVLVYQDTFYTLEQPVQATKNNKLLVYFSSIADLPFNASISRRMFFRNWENVKKYIPKNTYILRIADLGGVLGSFYLPSNFDRSFDKKIANLIEKIINDNSINEKNVVLFGSSKGGTGALYNGIRNGYKSLCVDPIVSDEFYLKTYNDLHFVSDVFPCSKEDVFGELMREYQNKDLSHIHVITAPSSEQYKFISKIILNNHCTIKGYDFFDDKDIKHTNIGTKTINFITAMLNNLLYGLEISFDKQDIKHINMS